MQVINEFASILHVVYIITILTGIVIGSFEEFSINLYKTIASSDADENLVTSPASIVLALGILLQGTSGVTRCQIERALGETEFKNLVEEIKFDSSIENANKIFVGVNYTLNLCYQHNGNFQFKSSISGFPRLCWHVKDHQRLG